MRFVSQRTESHPMSSAARCPFHSAAAGGGTTDADWWPNRLRLDILAQHSDRSDPLGPAFDYRREFASLDYFALKRDLQGRI